MFFKKQFSEIRVLEDSSNFFLFESIFCFNVTFKLENRFDILNSRKLFLETLQVGNSFSFFMGSSMCTMQYA